MDKWINGWSGFPIVERTMKYLAFKLLKLGSLEAWKQLEVEVYLLLPRDDRAQICICHDEVWRKRGT